MPRTGGTRFSGHSNVCHGRGEEDPDSKPTIHQLAEIKVPTQELSKRVDSVDTELNCRLKQTVPHIGEKIFIQCLKYIITKSKFKLVRHDRHHAATKSLAFCFYHVLHYQKDANHLAF